MSVLPVAATVRNRAQPKSNIYQDNSNLVESSARVLNKEAYRFSFQSLQLPSSANTLTIPKNLMVSHVLCQFQFNLTAAGSSPGWYLPSGWGFSAIRRIVMQYGGSEQLEIDGRDNLVRAMNECEDDRKKAALLELAGSGVYNNGGTDIVGLDDGQDITGGLATAVVPIYLPHSSVNSSRQIPFDSGVLNQNITIRVDLYSPEEIWQQTRWDTDAAPAALTNEQRSLTKAEFAVGQQAMIDSVASKAALVGPNGDRQLNYFFYYPQHFEKPFKLPINSVTGDPGASVKTLSEVEHVTLNGFRAGSLQSVLLYCERTDGFRYRNSPAQNGMRNPLDYVELADVKLEFGGQIVYQSENSKLGRALDIMVNINDSSYGYTPIGRVALNDPDAADPTRVPYVRIQLSQFSEVFRDYLQSGAQMSADTMQLSFRVIDDRDVDSTRTAASPTISYTIHAMYVYQAALSVARGVGSFTFVNPTPAPSQPQQLQMFP